MQAIFKINLNKLEQNYLKFAQFGEVFFPVKTNSNQIILNKLLSLGSGFECDCIEHIKKVLRADNKGKIIYSNVAKCESDIVWAIRHGISFFTVDDEQTLCKIIFYAKRQGLKTLKINVRLNIFDIFRAEFESKGVSDSRLGASVETCKKLLAKARNEKDLQILCGLSFYVQAEVHDNKKMLDDVSFYVSKFFEKADNILWLNIGGGSSVERIENSKQVVQNNMQKIGVSKIILEPGRHLVGNVENVLAKPLRAIKTDLNGGEVVCSLCVGVYHGLIDCKLHNRKFDFGIVRNGDFLPLLEHTKGEKLVLRGPTADSTDILGIFALPKIKIDENTTFEIKNVGAYVEVLNSAFSGKVKYKFEVEN